MGEDEKLTRDNNSNNGDYGAVEKPKRENDKDKTVDETSHDDEDQSHSLLGIFLIALGSFSFSCMFLLAKLLEGTANSFALVFYRSWVQIAISLFEIVRNGEHPLGPPGTRGWLCVRGGFGAGAVIAFFYAIQNLPLPDAVTLQFTTPPFAAAFAVCLAGEPWTVLDMIGAVVCLGGVVLIAHPSWLFGHHPDEEVDAGTVVQDPILKAIAIGVGLLGAAMAGMAYMSVRLIGHGASANVMVLYYGCMSIPIVVIGSKFLFGTYAVWIGDEPFNLLDWLFLFLTGIGGYGGQFFTNKGLQRETAATGTLVTCTQIVWTYIFELLFLHEVINKWSVGGTCLILGYMLIVGHVKMRQQNDFHEVVAGEPEEAALLYGSERNIKIDDVAIGTVGDKDEELQV